MTLQLFVHQIQRLSRLYHSRRKSRKHHFWHLRIRKLQAQVILERNQPTFISKPLQRKRIPKPLLRRKV